MQTSIYSQKFSIQTTNKLSDLLIEQMIFVLEETKPLICFTRLMLVASSAFGADMRESQCWF